MVKCCVPGCGAVGKRIFHAFPANSELRQKWIDATKARNLSEKDLNGYAKVCRYHFRETDFVSNHRNQRGLKPNTVPSLSLPQEATVRPSAFSHDHNYAAEDRKDKELWKRRYVVTAMPNEFQFDVQTIEIRDDSFSIESNQLKDRDFENFKIEALENKRRISKLEEELRVCKRRLHDTERKLKSKNDKLEKTREQLKTTKLNRSNVFLYLRTVFSEEQLLFFNMQLRNKGRKPAGRRYTAEEKSLALILYKHSPKNYRFMKKIFTLPDKRTLGRHSAQLIFGTGVNNKLFELIKEKVKSMTENERCCAMAWDEISLKAHLDYNVARDEIDGFVDYATIRKPVFGTHSLTFMVRGINSSWKQAIGYFITNGLKSFELVELIKLMTKAVLETGLKTVMSVCDQVYVNSAAIRRLVNPRLPKSIPLTGLLSYKVNNTTIIHCYDPPHLIKVIRNNLMTKNLEHSIVERWNINRQGGGNSIKKRKRMASWEHVECFYKWSNESSTKLLPKVTPEHIHPDKLKMRVSVATQVFSETVGKAMIKFSYDKHLPQNLGDTAHVLLFFNDVFDSINGSCASDRSELKGPVTEDSVHFNFWNFALEMIATMQWINKETGSPTNTTSVLKKFESTILGYIEICRLCLNLNMDKIALRNMNQDCLENFFGNIRSCCHNANSLIASHFRSAFATVFMTNSIAHSIKSNCEPDASTPLLTDVNHLLKNKIVSQTSTAENSENIVHCIDYPYGSSNDIVNREFDWQNIDPIIFDPEFSERELSAIDEQAISDLSKIVFGKLLKSTVCDECRPFLEISSQCNDSVKVPSEAFILNFKNIFGKIDESLEFICAESSLKRKVVDSLQNVKLDRMGCSDHFSHVEIKFKEYSSVFGIILFCKKINNILSRKNDILSENFNSIEQLAFTFCKKKKRIGKYSGKFEK